MKEVIQLFVFAGALAVPLSLSRGQDRFLRDCLPCRLLCPLGGDRGRVQPQCPPKWQRAVYLLESLRHVLSAYLLQLLLVHLLAHALPQLAFLVVVVNHSQHLGGQQVSDS